MHIYITKWCIVEYGTDAFWDLLDGAIGWREILQLKPTLLFCIMSLKSFAACSSGQWVKPGVLRNITRSLWIYGLAKALLKSLIAKEMFEIILMCSVRLSPFNAMTCHNDVKPWTRLLRHWPFVKGIQQWPLGAPHRKGSVMSHFDISFVHSRKKLLNKQSVVDVTGMYRDKHALRFMLYLRVFLWIAILHIDGFMQEWSISWWRHQMEIFSA